MSPYARTLKLSRRKSFGVGRKDPTAHRDLDREQLLSVHPAYHEAGHAVVNYWFGGWLNPDGVEIVKRWYTGTRCPKIYYTTEARVVGTIAGYVAEDKFHGGDLSNIFDDSTLLFNALELAREMQREGISVEELAKWDQGRSEDASGDDGLVAATLVEVKPAITNKEYKKKVRIHLEQTRRLLNEPAVWRAVRKLAVGLLKSGRLSNEEAIAVIGSDFKKIFGKGVARGQWPPPRHLLAAAGLT
jgi:hypothetical protein